MFNFAHALAHEWSAHCRLFETLFVTLCQTAMWVRAPSLEPDGTMSDLNLSTVDARQQLFGCSPHRIAQWLASPWQPPVRPAGMVRFCRGSRQRIRSPK